MKNKKYLNLALACSLLGSIAIAQESKTYDAEDIADIFYQLNSSPQDPKRKINHAKGFCASGVFEPAKDITTTIDVPLFEQTSIPMEIRYSLGGAIMDDKSKARGMALRFQGDNHHWTMVMLNTEVNFAKNPQEFGQFFEMRIPVNGKVDTEKIKRLTQEVDSYRNHAAIVDKMGISSLENTPFYSIHTFWFQTPKEKDLIPARWKFIPKDGIKYLDKEQLKNANKDFLLENFQTYTQTKPIEYDMYLVYPNKGDATDDTTALWKGKHKETLVGTLKVQQYQGMECNKDVYFPSDLPTGVEAPRDPLFEIRNTAYAITFGRRQ
ncbi:catalase family peroxidase [Helicobacter mesocricetorum]|uniref:catalase family peroxidase n=1 Tax=Helicobacter mesocricetorum TaxID=87012 RepID=UPI000CF0DA9E|nr:catalase family peroxidase [Helicobacter mesocricetorum]